MKLFEVEVQRTQVYKTYIMAEDIEAAEADAAELDPTFMGSFEEGELDFATHELETAPRGAEVWSGGADGDWIEP